MRWSILVLTQPSRVVFLNRLKLRLEPQLIGHENIELSIREFDTNMSLGENRQQMLNGARGEYVSFVDDDDLVAEDYVSSILPLLDGVDYVGFRLQLYIDGEPKKQTLHSLRYDGWSEGEFFYRDLSHLNPIRRELALLVPMHGGYGEDVRWADGLRETKAVKSEHFIDRVMYHYYFRSKKTD